MPLTDIQQFTATIASGQALSSGVRTDCNHVLSLSMPAAWTAAALTVQGSQDGTTWRNVFDEFGAELTIQAAADREIFLPPLRLAAYSFIRLRSGTSSVSVNQGAARDIIITTRRYA